MGKLCLLLLWWQYPLRLRGLNGSLCLCWPLLHSHHYHAHLPDCVQKSTHVMVRLVLILPSLNLFITESILLRSLITLG